MIEKVQSDPVVRAKVENEVQLQWYSLLEVGGGIEEGHRFAVELAKQEVKLWQMPVFWITVLLLPLVYMTLGAVLFRDVFTAELRAMVVGAIMTGALGGVVAYWFNTTFGSARKTDIMAEKQK
jgi:positive regulator of sigma E activity